MLEEKIEDTIKAENNVKLATFYRSEKYSKLKKIMENELLSKSINYKQSERFVNNFIQSLENNDDSDTNNFNESEIINEVKQNFGEIDFKYLELRKEQHLINRADITIIKDCKYSGYEKFMIWSI